MENVYVEKPKFRITKRKALVIGLAVFFSVMVISEPIYAQAPWWVSTIGAVAGGIIGSLTGSPIGTLAGATAGVLLANYLYDITHKTASMPSYFPDQNLIEAEYAASYENLTMQEVVDAAHQGQTTLELFTNDYYFNAQQQEAIVPYFLANSSLSEFNISLASGTYATLNNVSNSLYSPIDTVFYQTWFTGMTSNDNGFTDNQTGQTYSFCNGHIDLTGYAVYGSALAKGSYIFISPQDSSTQLFRCDAGKVNISVENYYTGKNYSIISNGVLPLNTSSIPYGLYNITSATSNVITTGIQILPSGSIDTTLASGYWRHNVDGFCIGDNMIFSNISMFSGSKVATTTGSLDGSVYNGGYDGIYTSEYLYNETPDYYTSLSSNLNNIYSSADAYFSALKSDGYTNIKQIPANQIIPFPSDVVPSSMLNGTFNWQELYEMYVAYLNDLNNTFHNNSLYNGKNFTKYVNQTMFVNGFLTEYGDLNYTVGTTNHYLNNTDFFIQTYTEKLHFQDGQRTNLTGEIYPVLVLNGSENGTLLYVDASIYIISLELAGKNITSYTLQPEPITYVLPSVTNVEPPSVPLFLIPGTLAPYLIVAVLIIAVLIAAMVGMAKKGKKAKKKRDN